MAHHNTDKVVERMQQLRSMGLHQEGAEFYANFDPLTCISIEDIQQYDDDHWQATLRTLRTRRSSALDWFNKQLQ